MKWQDIAVRVLAAALAALLGALTERQAPGVLTAPVEQVVPLAPVARPVLDVPSGSFSRQITRPWCSAPETRFLWVKK